MPSPFVKGNKLGKGRPKGALNKNTRNYLDFQLWFRNICEDLEKVSDPKERISISLSVIDRMMAKIQTLPGTPGESVQNAQSAAAVLRELEETPTDTNVNG